MKCFCGADSVYFRRHEGRYYCENCLCEQVEKNFLKACRPLVKPGERIGVALSGGKDSSVLLTLMKRLSPVARIELVAITVDEGITGYRDDSIVVAKQLAKDLDIEHHIYSFQENFGKRLDDIKTKKYCTYCGVFRRYTLNKAARELRCSRLALGHNMDDEAQSILMNVLRNDHNKALGESHETESANLVQRIRPLRNIPEKEVTAYAVIKGIRFHDAECPHSFDNVRRDVQAFLNTMEEKSPGTKLQVVHFYDSGMKERKAGSCSRCGEPTPNEVCKACLLSESI